MKKNILMLVMAVLAIYLSGCRSALVNLEVFPRDAKVIANGVYYDGGSPHLIECSTGRQLVITAYRDGYEKKTHVVDYSLSTQGKIYSWSSILVLPVIGLAFDSAWKLDENNISMTLERKEYE